MEQKDFLVRYLPTFVKRSLKAKIASFFVVFAVLITIEMVVLSILRNKALALPKQIELALSAKQSLQEARLSFEESLSQNSNDPKTTLSYFEASKSSLNVLAHGGIVSGIDYRFPTSEGITKSATEKLIRLIESLRTDVINTASLKNISLPVEVDSLETEPSTDFLDKKTAAILDIKSRSAQLKLDFDLLVSELRNDMADKQGTIALMMGVVLLVDVTVLGLFFLFMSRNISNPLKEIANAAQNQAFSETKTEDEIGVVASKLNDIISQLNEATKFIESIGEGKLDAVISKEHEGSPLSQALSSMRQKLSTINDEDQKRKWATEGLAKFAEILRTSEANLTVFGDNFIKSLVNYTHATQGGLYVWNDDKGDDQYIELIACYAYNRKKYEEKVIKAGEGLLGQAYLEQLTTHLTEIPADYFKINSGLGEIDPQSILIVPLKTNEKVYGLVELASLKKFEDHEIAFVEKLGESVAATLASVKTNENNRRLLGDFQEQTENLRSQEEEMRQNMEELTATQEEMARKEQDYLKQIEELQAKLLAGSSDGQWQIAQQTEQSLRDNLKALNIALVELKKSN